MAFPRTQCAAAHDSIRQLRVDRSLGRIIYYKAYERENRRWVMVRECFDGLDPDNRQVVVAGFRREVEFAAILREKDVYSSAPIVELYETLEVAGESCERLFLEFVSDRWLSNALSAGSLGERSALIVARDIARAVEAHAAYGIVHLNIQPTAVLLQDNADGDRTISGAKLDDYSHACRAGDSVNVDSLARMYRAPDLLDGAPPHCAHDLYNIGLLLWEMLTGTPYARAKAEAKQKGTAFDWPLNASPETKRIVEKALHADPDQRYREPSELVKNLDQALQLSSSPLTPDPPKRRRSGGLLLGSLAGIVLFLVLIAVAWAALGDEPAAAVSPTPTATTPNAPSSTRTAATNPTAATTVIVAVNATTTQAIVRTTRTTEAATLTAEATETASATATTQATATPAPTATPQPRLRFVRLNEDDDPTCISVQIRYIRTDGWFFRVDGLRLPEGYFKGENARVCGLSPRQQVTFTVYNSRSRIIHGGQGIPSRGGDMMRADWR